jgi:hypothetical protein
MLAISWVSRILFSTLAFEHFSEHFSKKVRERAVKASYLEASCVLLSVALGLGFVAGGCKKATPPPQEQATAEQPAALTPPTQADLPKGSKFLSAPGAVTCELEKTTISELDLPKDKWPSFVRRMERADKQEFLQGEITLVNRPFKVLLGDRLERDFFLYDVEKEFGPYWWGSWSLHSYHKIDGEFFEFMLFDDVSKIAARPYKGDLGVIKVGKGGRDLEKVEFNGSVHQKENVAAPIGMIEQHWTGPVGECEIPAGDYTPYLMKVTYDNLAIDISNNYHTNAQGQSRDKETVYGMQVRKDEPYVLDFSNEPMVIFDEPAKDKTTFRRGEQIRFAAVLIDPKLDIMIRGLDDTSVQVEREYKDRDGKVVHTAKVNKSLDPNVVIARADGEVIAEGVMPFG